MKLFYINFFSTAVFVLVANICFAQSVDFLEPENNAVVPPSFKVRLKLEGMTLAPAGTMTEGTGHHHLLINADDIDEGQTIPVNDTHIHLGQGQTEVEIFLPPGKYKLTMQFADGAHRSLGAKLRKTISIQVKHKGY
ncbi:MAG: DUF4399 domain-containing protein [Betaproteobacteria bacterium]